MHEEAMVADLVRHVKDVLAREGTDRAAAIRVRLGALAHCSEEGLRGRWALAVRDSPLAGARLEVEVSQDLHDPGAQAIRLESVVLDDGSSGPR